MIGAGCEKCFLKSSWESVDGRFLMNMREEVPEAMAECFHFSTVDPPRCSPNYGDVNLSLCKEALRLCVSAKRELLRT